MILRVTIQHLHLLREEAMKAHPVEACGILFGKLEEKEATVTRVVVTPNILHSTTRFEIDPQTFFKAFTQASNDGLEFIGLFHSHPVPANPSAIDLQYMRLWGDAVWLILSSTQEGKIAAFQMKKGVVHEITIKIE